VIKAVFFDFYNTVGMFWPPREELQATACGEFGIQVTPEGVDVGYGLADAYMARERGPNAQVMLAKPCTFMNLSGEAVGALVRYYRFDLDDILVVADDVNLPLGRLRARRGGSAGGHNGLQSVISLLGTEQFARLRVGVDRGDRRRDLSSHVLAGFESDELDTIKGAIVEAGDAVEAFADSGIDVMMNRFN